MIKNEVLLLKETVLFIFDLTLKKLFRFIDGKRVEVKDKDFMQFRYQ